MEDSLPMHLAWERHQLQRSPQLWSWGAVASLNAVPAVSPTVYSIAPFVIAVLCLLLCPLLCLPLCLTFLYSVLYCVLDGVFDCVFCCVFESCAIDES